ncbi:MAG: phospholipase D-like domain-containing protein, partial [Nitrososphaeria archaeon]
GRANISVHVLIYSFTLSNIADALISAKNRGVDVKIVFEKSQINQYSQYFRLANAGVSVRNDTNPDFMHNKIAIIDNIIVLTGSYNWSSSAENNNNENLIIIRDINVAREYENVFNGIWEHGR